MELFNYAGDKILEILRNLLPLSPFREFINRLQELPYLGYLNWFIPVGTIIKIGAVWLSAIALHYAYSILLRWAKAIE